MDETALASLLERFRPLGEAVCARLEAAIAELGLPRGESRPRPVFALADYAAVKDPFSGELGLTASWTDPHGHRIGTLRFHGDGSFYAEFDVAEPHPTDRRWFIEAVTAWGRDGVIKSEPRLLPALE